jgi:phosphoribosylaminoimidazolecarboxamide formyltransferase/IMP cyclohydrolase
MTDVVPVRRALISVADKRGLVGLGQELTGHGVSLVSSGSTADALREAGVPVTPVSEVTGQPEMLGGRVKTLHPAIHAGILANRRDPGHVNELIERGIEPFDLVVVNLYPFEETVAGGADPDAIIEQIDIGGPTLVRAAAKNFESVGVVVDPDRYELVLREIADEGGLRRDTRRRLAAEAFDLIARYDRAISDWFADEGAQRADDRSLPARLSLALEKVDDLRYGENPHQRGAIYRNPAGPGPLYGAQVLQGKEMSFNNWLDAESALSLVRSLPSPAAVIVKHNNPCGAAIGATLEQAYGKAIASDPQSAFGGVVAFNMEVDGAVAAAMAEVFTEVVLAPAYASGALEAFGRKPNLRVLATDLSGDGALEIRVLAGGALVQDRDAVTEARDEMKVVTSREPTANEWRDLLFGWAVAARVKSNAIVLARDGATVGIGAGQMSRVDSVGIACRKAGDRSRGSAMASDAFFPFRDGVDVAAEAGVTAVIQPGGSVRDEEVFQAAEEHHIAMVLTGRRHFRH